LIEADEDVGLATVYRVLTQFESAGLVERHHFEGGSSVFELTSVDHHDHIVCNGCGRVEEFFDQVIENQQEAIAEKYGFTITDHSMYLYGLCQDCQKRS
jgi:Fur family ferric uptake transcriptional regulator